MNSAGTVAATQTADYINPMLSATRTVFETMLDCVPRRVGMSLKDDIYPKYELSAVIGITGKAAGTIVLSLSHEAAVQVLNRMLGIETNEINSEVCDAVGELTNMIAGSAKAQMEHLQLSISVPSIIRGRDHRICYPSNISPICIPFESEIGSFSIEFAFTSV